ncbi:helix-turn-helix domain-containing protein [Streptantibioticus ferralitis]|uniref:XRE family transcriptional regulator n=1 Tax=Streptantibioticus ferralitis TaxID=236510 RepID=A0ABT5Z0Y2_9ACTN|nr:XRE family transcriptional regulator [Streptantibioticus ferralitis]MDF2257428.1 XRE family transcriptional regulator [Streptantibioticus ferralitis]
MTDNLNAILDAVGPRLRAIRKQRGSTLEQLAELTGMSVSTLSRIESGQRRPTLEVLLPLAQAYRMPLDELVGAPATGDPRIHPQPVNRDGVVWVPLSRDPGGLSAFKQVLPVPAQVPERLDQQVHEGYEWLYVLTGKLRLALGEKDFLLGAGEAAEFDTRVPHAIANAGRRPLELLIIFGQQGERMHLRARTK